jgi:hypothetical protein
MAQNCGDFCGGMALSQSEVMPLEPDRFNLLVYADERGNLHPVRTPADWQKRRQHILAAMQTGHGQFAKRREASATQPAGGGRTGLWQFPSPQNRLHARTQMTA